MSVISLGQELAPTNTLGEEKERIVKVLDSVLPIETDNIIKNNEIYDVLVKSEKSKKELISYKNKKINPIMYVMDVFNKDDKTIFRVFVTDPPKKDEKKEKEDPVIFDHFAFKYEPDNPALGKDYIQLDMPYKLLEDKNFLMKLGLGLLLFMAIAPLMFGLVWGISKLYKKRKYKRLRHLKKKELDSFLKSVQERRDFEELYQKKEEILNYLDFDNKKFKDLLSGIDQYQYMKTWSKEQLELLQNKLQELLRMDRGV